MGRQPRLGEDVVGGEYAEEGEDEEAAEAVERAEEDQEVRRLEARRAVAERDGGDEQREPAELQREEELRDELAAVRIRRPEGRHDRLAREDHHVPDLFEQVLHGQEPAIGDASNQASLLRSSPRAGGTTPPCNVER